jgi:hypothetical protein
VELNIERATIKAKVATLKAQLLQELGVHVDGNDDMEQRKSFIPEESPDSENSKDLIGDNDDDDDFDENDIWSNRNLRRTRRRGKRLANANKAQLSTPNRTKDLQTPSLPTLEGSLELPQQQQNQQTLPPDLFNFLVHSEPCSWPFSLSVMVALIQDLLFGLLASNQWSGGIPEIHWIYLPISTQPFDLHKSWQFLYLS